MRRLAFALALVVVYPARAHACYNTVILDTNEAAKLVARAERAIDVGDYRRAYGLLTGDYELPNAGLRRRRTLLLAVAQLRLGNAEEAVRRLAGLERSRPDDPFVRTRIAEGLVVVESSSARGRALLDRKAREIFDELEARDLIVDAQGWAALARLRERLGDQAGFERAVIHCRAAAHEPSVCPTRSQTLTLRS